MKKLFFALTLSILALLFAFSLSAAEIIATGNCGADGDNVKWSLDSEGTLTISGSGKIKNCYMNTPLSEYSGLLSENKTTNYELIAKVKKIEILDGITHIGVNAFNFGFDSLTSVTMSDSVISIGEAAFYGCSLLSMVSFSRNLKEIGYNAFNGTALSQLDLPDTLEVIKPGAFEYCTSLRTVKLPGNIKEIHASSFDENVVLEGLTVIDGVYFTNDMKMLVKYPKTKTDSSYSVPQNVKRIADYAFAGNKNIKEIILNEGLESIGGHAFDGCVRIKDLTIPSTVSDIGITGIARFNSPSALYYLELDTLTVYNRDIVVFHMNIDGLRSFSKIVYCYRGSKTDIFYKEYNEAWWDYGTPTLIYLDDLHTHTYDSGVITLEPTCIADGVKTYTCTDCGGTKTETIPMLGHTFGEAVIVDATCTAEGTKTATCTVCQHEEVETLRIIDHVCDRWTESIPVRAGVDGEESGVCINCQNTVTRVVAALPANEPVIRLTGNTDSEGKIHIFVILENNLHGFDKFGFNVNFDNLHLSLLETISQNSIAVFETVDDNNGVVAVNYAGTDAVTADGTICELVFEPTGEPFEGDLPISVAMDSGSATYTASQETVTLAPSLVGCTIHVEVTAPETTENIETTSPDENATAQTASSNRQSNVWLISVIIILAVLVVVAVIVIILLLVKNKKK
ncbi:MAG: leucine-rich repeat domain-containing protein [Clostridia bacterium]|nr:leucine-rich repeat domain-containing protein [Clostridia bacterium]